MNRENTGLVIGLTGGIGAGKSMVATILRTLGMSVYDADRRARRLYRTDAQLLGQVFAEWGDAVRDASGNLDLKQLSDLVFSDSDSLKRLNHMVHPAVRKDFDAWKAERFDEGNRVVFRESAILFESGSDEDCDAVWGVMAPDHLRIQRAAKRPGWTPEHVVSRMAHQWPQDKVMEPCAVVLVNDGCEALVPQIVSALDSI